jgi:alpha-tubulin suppressor-like RCC1 family protein
MVPVAVQADLKFSQLEAGSGTTCGLSTSGKAYCWGRNDLGQLGMGPASGGQIGDQSLSPVSVGDPLASSVLKQIVTRGPKTCALTSEGKAYCWGNNTVFELGTTTAGVNCYGGKRCSLFPTAVNSSATFTSLTASQFATCGIASSGETLCWGMDYERLFGAENVPACGTSGTSFGCTATPVQGASGFLTLSGSRSNTCGMKSDGIVYCWGGNAFGQRGWGGFDPDPTPQPFSINPASAP